MWVDRMLDPHCDFELFSPMTLTLDFQGQILKKVLTHEWDAWMTWNKRYVSRLNVGPMLWLITKWPHSWPWPWIFNVKFWNSCISHSQEGEGHLTWNERDYESIGCYTYIVTFSYDIDLGFSRSNFKNAVSQEWEGWLTWNQKDVSR